MTISEMLSQSGILTLLGMGVVFSFLIIMIFAMTGLHAVIHALGWDKEEKLFFRQFQNVLQINFCAVGKQKHLFIRIDPLQPSLKPDVGAAAFPGVLPEIPDVYRRFFPDTQLQSGKGPVDLRQDPFIGEDPRLGQPAGFVNGLLKAGQGGKGGKLGRPVCGIHPGMALRNGMGQVKDIVILSAHALCPPIWPFRSRAVAPSS